MKPENIKYNTALELALMVMIGVFGTGSDRKKALGERYDEVQGIVDRIYKNKTVPISDINQKFDFINEEMKRELFK